MMRWNQKELITHVDRRLREGITYEEIAVEVDIPLSTLYHKIRRAGYKTGKALIPIRVESISDSITQHPSNKAEVA